MQESGISQRQLAKEIGTLPNSISRTLGGRVGTVPGLWPRILDALDLELIVIPKRKGETEK